MNSLVIYTFYQCSQRSFKKTQHKHKLQIKITNTKHIKFILTENNITVSLILAPDTCHIVLSSDDVRLFIMYGKFGIKASTNN